jgi:hypothetical protein
MNALTLLIICVVAQIVIAGALGIYLFRHFRQDRRVEKTRVEKTEESPAPFPTAGEK